MRRNLNLQIGAVSLLLCTALTACGARETPIPPLPTAPRATLPPVLPSTPASLEQVPQTPNAGEMLFSAGSDLFLPFQSCLDLDMGKINEESQSACDFFAKTVENDAGRIYLQFRPLASAAFAFDGLFPQQPTIQQCRELSGYVSTERSANPVGQYICYRTSDARYGILYVKDWDTDNGLTLNWQTYPNAADLSSKVETPYDAAAFVADLTVLDGTSLAPGESFTKGWRLRNSGTTTWDEAYRLIFVSGAQMSAPPEQGLPIRVLPGDSVDIYAQLRAPEQIGDYTGHWMLRNAAGESFGIGVGAQQTFYVNILVTAP